MLCFIFFFFFNVNSRVLEFFFNNDMDLFNIFELFFDDIFTNIISYVDIDL